MTLPKATIFSLGGTISSTDAGGEGVEPTLTGEALVSEVPEIGEVADVSAVSFRQASSGELTIDDLAELAVEIRARVEAGEAGAVVTQGTDTIEETAFVLDLLLDIGAPVVVTGAMRNPTLPGADGPANLLASVRVAASEAAQGIGPVVVMNEEVHAARFVSKTHTQNPATFSSPSAGPVGWISEGKVRVVMRPSGRFQPPFSEDAPNLPVALHKVTFGDDGRLLPEMDRLGYAGLVVEAMGGGHVPSVMVEKLDNLAVKMPVILASRTGSGEVLHETYSFPGSEIDLLGRGLIGAGALDGPKARLLLSLLLGAGVDRAGIKAAFDSWLDA